MSTTPIDELSNRYFARCLELSPELLTSVGGHGDQGRFSDYSPDGYAEKAELDRSTLRELATLSPQNTNDGIGKSALEERLRVNLDLYEAGESISLDVIASPVQEIRDIFDLMDTHTQEDWETIERRLQAVPEALAGYRTSLAYRQERGPALALRQVERCAEQAEALAAPSSAFTKLVANGQALYPQLAGKLEKAATQARRAYGEFAQFLRSSIAPSATKVDGVGRERYELFSRLFLGARIDLDETYEWGMEELTSIIHEQENVVKELFGPGVSIPEAMERLNNSPAYRVHGTHALKEWMQATADEAMEAMSTHFDIPEPLKTIEAMVITEGTGGIYYTGPSDDFSRPGRMWWSVPAGVEDFATWQEKTTVYHEGVPGHHLQVGMATYLRDQLNDWRRQGCWVSGHGEGWALYAEQLMQELGYQNDLGDRLGVLDSMRLRAARVVVDLGVHLQKNAGRWGEGTWDYQSAWAFLCENVAMDRSFLSFELDRYLGWPGQAPSYKIGQRLWNQLREEARKEAHAHGHEFDEKGWHMRALSMGSVGLDIMAQALRSSNSSEAHHE